MTFTHIWRWQTLLGHRFGQPCRVTAASRKPAAAVAAPMILNPPAAKNMGTIRVRFADGFEAVTSRFAVRRMD